MVLTEKKSDFFLKKQKPVSLCSGEVMWPAWSTKLTCVYYLKEINGDEWSASRLFRFYSGVNMVMGLDWTRKQDWMRWRGGPDSIYPTKRPYQRELNRYVFSNTSQSVGNMPVLHDMSTCSPQQNNVHKEEEVLEVPRAIDCSREWHTVWHNTLSEWGERTLWGTVVWVSCTACMRCTARGQCSSPKFRFCKNYR
jgi:hypothetical protein